MAQQLSKDDLRRYARLGAMRRLEDLRREEASIRAAFPELFGASRGRASKASAPAATASRRRRTMSAAQRKDVSARMKKYWAARRKAKNG